MKATEAVNDDNCDIDYRHNLLEAAVSQVSEHFDSVLIIATAHGLNEKTHYFTTGRGNVYANMGAADRWLRNAQHMTRKN